MLHSRSAHARVWMTALTLIAATHVHARAFTHKLCMVLHIFCCNLTHYHAVSLSTSIIGIYLTVAAYVHAHVVLHACVLCE